MLISKNRFLLPWQQFTHIFYEYDVKQKHGHGLPSAGIESGATSEYPATHLHVIE